MVLAACKALPWLWLLGGSTATAEYTELFFATAKSGWACPGMVYVCVPPQVCAFSPLLNKNVCCNSGSSDQICWDGPTSSCGSNRITCGTGNETWCCLDQREECTQFNGQVRVCWETGTNPLAGIPTQMVNDTFSSLSSANPTASTLSFNLAAVSRTSASSASQTTSSDTASPNPTVLGSGTSKSGLSAGGIAGVVVGGVLGLALIVSIIFFLLQRKKHAQRTGHGLEGNPDREGMQEKEAAQEYPFALSAQKDAHEVEAVPAGLPAELPNAYGPPELVGSRPVGA